MGEYYKSYKGDTRCVDYGSQEVAIMENYMEIMLFAEMESRAVIIGI